MLIFSIIFRCKEEEKRNLFEVFLHISRTYVCQYSNPYSGYLYVQTVIVVFSLLTLVSKQSHSLPLFIVGLRCPCLLLLVIIRLNRSLTYLESGKWFLLVITIYYTNHISFYFYIWTRGLTKVKIFLYVNISQYFCYITTQPLYVSTL